MRYFRFALVAIALAAAASDAIAQQLRPCNGVSSCQQAYGRCTARRVNEGLTKLDCEQSLSICNRTGNWIGGKFNDGSQVRCRIAKS